MPDSLTRLFMRATQERPGINSGPFCVFDLERFSSWYRVSVGACSAGLLAGCSVGLPAHAHSTPIREIL